MIDASIVQAPRQSLSKEEKAIVSEGAMMPADWKPVKRRQKDMDARDEETRQVLLWLQGVGQRRQGYKLVRKL